MIEQQGKIVWAEGEHAAIRLGASTGCSACDAGKGCGAGVFGRLLQRKPVTLELKNTVDARAGQAVVVGLPESLFLSLVIRLYLAPLVGGIGGAVVGHLVAGRYGASPAIADLAALVGVFAGGGCLLWWNRRRQIEFPRDIDVHLVRAADCQSQERID